MLIVGIIVVLVALFFGVKGLSSLYAGRNADKNMIEDSVLESAEVPVTTPTPAAVEDSIATVTPTEVPTLGGALEKNADSDVTALIVNYYAALQNRDVDAVRAITDILSDADVASVANAAPTTYSDVTVYTKDGQSKDTVIVYAYYHYQTEGAAVLPGLSQLIVIKGQDGTWRIKTSEADDSLKAYISRLNEETDVKTLVESVQTEYDSAQAKAEDEAKDAEEAKAAEAAAQAQAQAEAEARAQAEAEAAAKAAEEAAAQAAAEAANRETPAYTLGTCNVRSGPGYDYKVIYADLPKGSQLVVIGDTDAGWLHIRCGDIEGYMGGRFIAF